MSSHSIMSIISQSSATHQSSAQQSHSTVSNMMSTSTTTSTGTTCLSKTRRENIWEASFTEAFHGDVMVVLAITTAVSCASDTSLEGERVSGLS
jgi:hypothetical protein